MVFVLVSLSSLTSLRQRRRDRTLSDESPLRPPWVPCFLKVLAHLEYGNPSVLVGRESMTVMVG